MEPGVFKKIKFADAKETMAVADEMAQHFGIPLDELVKNVTTTAKDSRATMSANIGIRALRWNPKYYKNSAQDNHIEVLMNRTQGGGLFHPANQTQASTTAHEIAHLLGGRLREPETEVINEAMTAVNAQRTARGETALGRDDLRASITSKRGYSMKSDDETVAEAFADVYANRSKAAPFSQEIWRNIERRFGVKQSWLGGQP